MRRAVRVDSEEWEQLVDSISNDRVSPIGVTLADENSDFQYGIYRFDKKQYVVKVVIDGLWMKFIWAMEVDDAELREPFIFYKVSESCKGYLEEVKVKPKNKKEKQMEKANVANNNNSDNSRDAKIVATATKVDAGYRVPLNGTPTLEGALITPVTKKRRGRPAGSTNKAPAKVKVFAKGASETAKKYRKIDDSTKRQIIAEVEAAGWGKKGEILTKRGVTAAHVASWKKQFVKISK